MISQKLPKDTRLSVSLLAIKNYEYKKFLHIVEHSYDIFCFKCYT